MRKFLQRLFLFLLPVAVVVYPVDRLLSEALARSHAFAGEFEVWNDIYSDTLDVDIAVYGSSRAFVHVDPRILQSVLGLKAYNFGVEGQRFRVQYLRHLEYLDHDPPPSMILVPADIHNLLPKDELYGLEQFIPYMLWNERFREHLGRFKGFEDLDFRIPLLRFAGRKNVWHALVMAVIKKDVPTRDLGYMPVGKHWTGNVDGSDEDRGGYDMRMDPEQLVLFERFVQECAAKGIDVVMVNAPEYIAFQHRVRNRDEVLSTYRDISVRYAIPFLDYSNDPICTDTAYFYNVIHLNKKGAELFTVQLAKDLRSLTRQR